MDYTILDSGNLMKLEKVGDYKLIRPALNAFWEPSLPRSEWEDAAGAFTRNSSGGGTWKWNSKLPESWTINYGGTTFIVKPTSFGHLGFFAEQKDNWNWLKKEIKKQEKINTLNLFAYSGGSSLAMAEAGARTCHLDAAKGMVDWAKDNLVLNTHINEGIRWIVDDVNKFISRELRRGNEYQGIVLDPPSFGRGPKGQLWKIESDLLDLLKNCKKLMGKNPKFLLLSMHSQGFTPCSLERVVSSILGSEGKITSGEMTMKENSGRLLPAGIYARWTS